MGRTTTGVIDDTKPDLSHIGTNPKGRYAEHHHHACHMMPPLECGSKGNVYRGIGAGKWGHVTHGVHDTFITDNIALDFPGAGFITEDGYEVRNEFRENLACYNLNQDPNLQSARGNLLNNQPGVEGTGIWAHGIHNVFVGNQAWNNTVGINLFNRDGKTGLYPSVPGGTPDTLYQAPDLTNNPPLVFTENTVVANNTGQEHWDLAQAPLMETLRAINNFTGAFVSAGASVQSANYKNPVFIQTYDPAVAQGWNGQCILMTTGYSDPFIITGGYLSGAAVAITGVPNTSYTATDCTFQCKIGIYIDVKLADAEAFGVKFYFSGYTFLPLGSLPHQYVVDVTGVLWDGTGPFPLDGDGPPPPPPPSWVTLPGIFQQQQQPDPTKFRFCDVNGMNCVDFVKA
jgi:hypothetical protein